MVSFKSMFQGAFKPRQKKWSAIVLLIILVLAAAYLLRSCYRYEAAHKSLYTIGRDSSWYPLKLYGKEKNLQAFSNDLLTAISKDIGVHFKWANTSPNNLLDNLNNEEDDAILTALRPNPVTKEHYLFSNLVFETGPVLVVRQDAPYSSIAELHGLEVGTVLGAAQGFNPLQEAGADDLNLSMHIYDTINQAMEALVKDRIDGVIVDAIPAYTMAEGFYAGAIKIVIAPINDEGLRLVALKTPEGALLIKSFNEALERLKADGTYDELISKWGLINPEKRFSPQWSPKNEHLETSVYPAGFAKIPGKYNGWPYRHRVYGNRR